MIVSVQYDDSGLVRYFDVDGYLPNLEGFLQLFMLDKSIIWVNLDKIMSFHIEYNEVDDDSYEKYEGELN